MSYTCTECGKYIAGNANDPVHVTSLGTHHETCMRIAHARAANEAIEKEKQKEVTKAEKSKRMSALGKQRMSDPRLRKEAAERLSLARSKRSKATYP